MKIALIAISRCGAGLAQRVMKSWASGSGGAQKFDAKFYLLEKYRDAARRPADHPAVYFKKSLSKLTEELFNRFNGIVYFASVGIAVRSVAPLVKNKRTDPAVVAVDAAGRFAVSVLSGHEGGANDLAREVARALGRGARPVITTASEAGKDDFISLGIGCRRGATSREIENLARRTLSANGLPWNGVRVVGTAEIKRGEKGLRVFAERHGWKLRFFSRGELNRIGRHAPTPSPYALKHIGTNGVAEPAAMLAAGAAEVLVPRVKSRKVTLAVCRIPS